MTHRVALVTCLVQEVDPDATLLLGALAQEGIEGSLQSWDDPDVDWDSFDLCVVRSTWNYVDRRDEFLAWARATPRLENPLDVLTYSTDKHYLSQLQDADVRIVPTQFVDVGSEPLWLSTGVLVVKPTIGAGAFDAARYDETQRGAAADHVAALHARGRDVMIQPYVATVDDVGERALVYIDGTFSHALRKGAMLHVDEANRDNDFREAQMGSIDTDDEMTAFADRVLSACGFRDLLYARVDIVALPGGWAVMELEMVEPSLFLTYHPPAATALARAIRARLDRRPPR